MKTKQKAKEKMESPLPKLFKAVLLVIHETFTTKGSQDRVATAWYV